ADHWRHAGGWVVGWHAPPPRSRLRVVQSTEQDIADKLRMNAEGCSDRIVGTGEGDGLRSILAQRFGGVKLQSSLPFGATEVRLTVDLGSCYDRRRPSICYRQLHNRAIMEQLPAYLDRIRNCFPALSVSNVRPNSDGLVNDVVIV